MNMTTKISKEKVSQEDQNEETSQDGVKPTMYHVPPSNGVLTSDEAAASIEPVAQRQRDILFAYVCDQYMLGTTNQEAEDASACPPRRSAPECWNSARRGSS